MGPCCGSNNERGIVERPDGAITVASKQDSKIPKKDPLKKSVYKFS